MNKISSKKKYILQNGHPQIISLDIISHFDPFVFSILTLSMIFSIVPRMCHGVLVFRTLRWFSAGVKKASILQCQELLSINVFDCSFTIVVFFLPILDITHSYVTPIICITKYIVICSVFQFYKDFVNCFFFLLLSFFYNFCCLELLFSSSSINELCPQNLFLCW